MKKFKKLEIAICDDEDTVASDIEKRIFKLGEKFEVDVETDIFNDGKTLSAFIYNGNRYDLIYLDIEMKMENGVEAARKIREIDKSVLIIYITSHESFAKEVFEVSAFRFITKPISNEIFERYFWNAFQELRDNPVYYHYQYKKVSYKVPINDIIYFQSDKRVTYIVTQKDWKKCYGKLNDIEQKLIGGGFCFIRIHQSFLINPKFVDVFLYDSVIMVDGTTLNISEKRRKQAGELYLKYKGEKFDM